MLGKAKEYGHVYIVTNATDGWVERTARCYLPKVYEAIQEDVKIISARSKYE